MSRTLRATSPTALGFESHSVGTQPPICAGVLLRTAIHESGLQVKYVALDMKIPANHFSEMLTSKRRFPWERIELAPEAVLRPFARLFAEARGFAVSERCPVAAAAADVQIAIAKFQALMTSRLPERATKSARMDLPADARGEPAK